MSNKQKLPKHITAHERGRLITGKGVVLCGDNNICWWIPDERKYDADSLICAIKRISEGTGWQKTYGRVGKQIVF